MQRIVEPIPTVAKKIIKSAVPDGLIDAISPTDVATHPENLSFAWLRIQLAELEHPTLETYFAIDSAETPIPSLCAPEASFAALIDSVIAVGSQSDLAFVYMVDGKRMHPTDKAQLSATLRERPTTKIHLSRDGHVVTFYVEKWRTADRVLVAPRTNPVTMKLYLNDSAAQAFLQQPGQRLTDLHPCPMADRCTFDVDVVYTWVNADDPQWQALLATHAGAHVSASEPGGAQSADGSVMADRFVGRDELRYSIRSLLTYAPWVRYVYVVTNCTPPDWFDEANGRVRWVYHDEIMDAADLPTFNSHAIEASIHKVPGLSEHFLYFNDDIFLLKPVLKSDFFLSNGLAKTRPEPYGTIHGEVNESDPDYVNAARNGQVLLQGEFSKTASTVHTHSPQSMRLSVVQACEAAFAGAYANTRSNRFRSSSDISPTSFLYPNYAYLSGAAVTDYPETALVSATKSYPEMFASYIEMMRERRYPKLPLTLCINDGGGSTQDADWGDAVVNFLGSAFDKPSHAERARPSRHQ